MSAVPTAVLTAIAEGVVAITPNRRLKRHLQNKFDAAQRVAGQCSWPTPAILPYTTWLAALWHDLVGARSAPTSTLLAPSQTSLLWRRVIDAAPIELLDPSGAAALAAEAWSIVHAWGTGGATWRGWRPCETTEGDDAGLFAAWAEAYAAELRRIEAVDAAQLADVLVAHAHVLAQGRRAVFTGFIELTPQQQRLMAALNEGGADIRILLGENAAAMAVSRTTAATPREEVMAALNWARARALAHPASSIGVVIEDLARRRAEIVALAQDVLCPGLLLPAHATARRPFEVSLGTPLASVPLVIAALDLISLADAALPTADAAALLRSPYLFDAEAALPRRAAIERDWLADGLREVTLTDAIEALARRCPGLADRWQRARPLGLPVHAASPREWVDAWRGWLLGAGWPGSRSLDSADYQARTAWEELLTQFAQLGAVVPRLERYAAIETLRSMAQERVFQPEGEGPSIQLLGLLEGSGLDFDALWVAGLSADRWPRAPSPNPLLPLAWQRMRHVPHSSAANELAYARKVTLDFATAAPVVMFSCAAAADDHPLSPSALLMDYPEVATPLSAQPWTCAIAASGKVEQLHADDRAPAMAEGSRASGGSRLIAAQSDCPFQAAARYRLDVDKWPRLPAGLSREERGAFAHAALAALWIRLRDHASLAALEAEELAGHIEATVRAVLSKVSSARRRNVPAVVWKAETRRLCAVLDAWLAIERERPPFEVSSVEAPATVKLGPLVFSLRIDRIDALADGGVAIIDYKTGRAVRPQQWFDARPQAPQLGAYMLAQRGIAPGAAIRALAYGQLKAQAIQAIGLAADSAAWPRLGSLKTVDAVVDWTDLENWWSERLSALASEIAAGCASVTPRERPSPCRACGLNALCRIESVRLVRDNGSADV